MLSHKTNKLITWSFYFLLVLFLVFYLKSIDYSELQNIQIQWIYVVYCTFLGLVSRYFGAYIWMVLLRGLGSGVIKEKIQLINVYAKSWMGRYIPGTAPWILGKIHFASQHGISKNKLAVSSLLEGGLQICVTMVLSAILLILDPRLSVVNQTVKVLMVFAIISGITLMTPPVFNKIISVIYKIIRKKELALEHLTNGKTITKGASLYTINALIGGLGFFFIAKAVYPDLQYSNLLFIMGASSLAGAVSMLAIFAPSGIGVREGIQLGLLSIIMPTEYALVITIFTRLWGVAMDFIFLGTSFVLMKISKKS